MTHSESPEAPGKSEGPREPSRSPGLSEPLYSDEATSSQLPPPAPTPRIPWWIKAVPFVLSAFLFLSGIFAMFSPLPLLILSLQTKRRWFMLALLTNVAMVAALGGGVSLGVYSIFVLSLALTLPEFLRRKRSIEASAALGLLSMLLAAVLAGVVYAQIRHVNLVTEVPRIASEAVDYLMKGMSSESRTEWLDGMEPDEWKRNFLLELPSAIGVFALVVVWANLLIVLRLNPGRIRERMGLDAGFFRKWKAPAFLVWPTILAGFLTLWDMGWPSDVALNLLKFLLAVYAIQGLSILSFIFDVWNIRGLMRSLGFLAAVFLMMPLVLSIGFFDLWFDFRAKLRQS